MRIDSEQNVKDAEKILIQGDLSDMKSKLKLLEKERSLNFYNELKSKRIKKIKSKLYHKIKNRVKKLNSKKINLPGRQART